jgi:hypothetical protein
MSWDPRLGIWSWWRFRGTTPRNADVWTLDIVGKKYELWLGTGPHAYITLFKGPTEIWSKERNKKNCRCYACNMMNFKISPEAARVISEAMRDPDRPVRKLPPRGCQPGDCCGDDDAHL